MGEWKDEKRIKGLLFDKSEMSRRNPSCIFQSLWPLQSPGLSGLFVPSPAPSLDSF